MPRFSRQWDLRPTQPVRLLFSSPYYFSANEEEEIQIALRNETAQAITATIRVDVNKTAPIFIQNEGSNVVFSGEVQGGEQKGRVVKIYIPFDVKGSYANNTLGTNVDLSLWTRVSGYSSIRISGLPIGIAPVPWMMTLFTGVFSLLSGLSLWWIKEWWDVVKKQLEKRL